MPTRVYHKKDSVYWGPNVGFVMIERSSENSTWNNSGVVNGRLVRTAQACNMKKASCYHWTVDGSKTVALFPVMGNCDAIPMPPGTWASVDNSAYAKFYGKLKKGSASLGVTAASWKQSRNMIANRHNAVAKTLDSSYHGLLGNRGAVQRLRREREPLANQVLETQFGWKPLFEDIYAALYTACSERSDAEWITSRASETIQCQSITGLDSTGWGFREFLQWNGKRWSTYNARVSVQNQNAYLLNRLGLVNPATVIWDLIPWSFVVGMFVNVNQVIGSLSNEVGLSVTDYNITRGQKFNLINNRDPRGSGLEAYGSGRSGCQYSARTRSTQLSGFPRPTLELKIPDFSWGLALTASSLVIQKISKINNLIRLI